MPAQRTQLQRAFAIERLPALVVAALSMTVYCAFSYFQYRHFLTPSWDLGIFAQLMQAYAQGQLPPVVPIKGAGFNLWGDHFHPILLLLTPFYWLHPQPDTLLYVQNGLVALSAYLLCRFAQRVLPTAGAVLLAAAYAFSFGITQAVATQFHEVACALPLLVMSLGHMVLARGQDRSEHLIRAGLWALPLAWVKEDLGFTVTVIGLLIMVRSGRLAAVGAAVAPRRGATPASWRVRFRQAVDSLAASTAAVTGLAVMTWGLAWTLLAVEVILPHFNTNGVFDYANKIDLPAAVGDPLQSAALMFYPWQKSLTLGTLLLVGVLCWVASPLALVTVPTLAWRFLSDNEGYWDTTWHYSMVLMPMVFCALMDALARFSHPARTRVRPASQRRIVARWREATEAFRAPSGIVVPALAALVAAVMLFQSPLTQLGNPHFATGQLSAEDRMKQSVVDSIPRGSVVASDLSVLTYLVPEREVYWIGHRGAPAPEYVVIDRANSAWGGQPPEDPVAYGREHFGVSYQVFRQIGTVTVLQRTVR